MKSQDRIWLSSPHMGGKEIGYINEAFDTNWIAPLGPNVDGFEEELSSYIDTPYVAALSSGTAAIHLALILLGVERDDEVIAQSFTFCGTTNPILYLGAKPILIDSDASTWNMDPELLEEVIIDRIAKNKKPKAVIVVHLYGMPAQIERIEAICKKYKVALIEDAAEALGSIINGRKAGSFGDLSVLSFNGNKIITTSGGGALLSKNEALIKRSRFLATQARDDEAHFEHSELGYNYRMSNVLAGIGRGQLKVLDNHIERRREINSLYQRALQIDGIEFQIESGKGVYSNYWLTAITIDNEKVGRSREEVRLKLWESNIETRPLWKPMHLQPLYKGCSYYGNGVCDELFENGLCLPSGSNLTDSDVSRVIEGFLNAIN